MKLPRVIPVLSILDGGLVKTKYFKNPVYIGDPINAIKIFNEKEVDEIILLNINNTINKDQIDYTHIENIVSESFLPLGYGGGLDCLEKIKKIFGVGIEKVIINSSLFNTKLISDAAKIFGSQSIVVCIDARKSLFGKILTYTKSGKQKYSILPAEIAKTVVDAGAGEIIIQSIDKDGTMNGYDLELIQSVTNEVNVPVVASGGAGSVEHLKDAINIGGASDVCGGSMFVYRGGQRGILINYPKKVIIEKLFEI